MADKGGAYGAKANDTEFRKKWDKEEYAERARQKDAEAYDLAKENEERAKQGMLCLCLHTGSGLNDTGKRPLKGNKKVLPKPTELMKQREGPLELEKNLNKAMVVQNISGRGHGVPGFFCETCNRTYKDTTGYLDHINGRARVYTVPCTIVWC